MKADFAARGVIHFAGHETSKQVFRYPPRHRQTCRDFQCTTNEQHLGEEIFDADLRDNAEEDVAHADQHDFPPPAPGTALLVAQRKRGVPMFLDIQRKIRYGAVKQEEANGRQNIKHNPDRKSADKLNFQGGVGQDEGRPG